MDLDAVADELYGLRPDEFIAARAERAAAARTAGDRRLSEQIGRLRRPSMSAWASNLLVREQPDQVQSLTGLGEALRQAHQELDGEQLRDLAHQQRLLVGALSRQAAQLAARAGRPIGDEAQREIQETLQAVLGDPDAARQWAAGRLVKPLAPAAGFPAATAPPRRSSPPGRPVSPSPAQTSASPAVSERRRGQLDDARRAAEESDREARAREEEAGAAGHQARDARQRLDERQQRVTALTAELERAEEELRKARVDDRAARERAREADRQAREARRRATTAAARADRLAACDRSR
ncbi:hypothetical protein QF035_009120 [Streptomyces umbrinus]|uniref:Transposase n=1 Tax=Streptomyces umbrinus TaxID=67370 RepID=A0ABU0T782_9ACTN|nr:hypothetical protein [Streptomyces umbrinus]MDQ1031538.1 hypothetical protein [Streptomyces umbrinus]